VNVSWSHIPSLPIPRVISDEESVGRLAAQHLAGLGFRRFAYCGLPRQTSYVDRVEPAYLDELKRMGHSVVVFKPPRLSSAAWKFVTVSNLRRWLRGLAKPIGILTWEPERGRIIMEACRAEKIVIPDEVAVVTTADDELYCRISHPPLSAVDERPREIGYRAAELLAKLIAGRRPPAGPILIPPQRVISRLSTEVIAIDDSAVASAVRFIRQHYLKPITVRDVVAAVAISRRALELRFQAALGRSPAAEIRRVRLSRAAELVADTDWPISQIVKETGFGSVEVFDRVFRRELGQTPSDYRHTRPSRS
jgi:LacI family transcriptional regulator